LSGRRSLAVWILALPLYLCVSLEHVERHFGRHPYVFATVMAAVGMTCWFGAVNARPKMLILTALFAPLLGALAGYWVVLALYWSELGRLNPPIDLILGVAASLMAIGLSKALVLSLLLLVPALWEIKGRAWTMSK
jgi:hypothetical protein